MKPPDKEYGIHLAKIVSKFSPFVANMLEFYLANELNNLDWDPDGQWIRQDPDFPDLLFDGPIYPKPGFEIKTWFPLATEITARFKDSASFFQKDHVYVCLIAWLPEFIIYGKPKVIDMWIGSANSLANSRDSHYHNPPDYLIFEPEDTSDRTRNLQQSNTNGYKFQGSPQLLHEAKKEVMSWGPGCNTYQCTKEYQDKLKSLTKKYTYRLDTNYSKLDRIQHKDLEAFKSHVLGTIVEGKSIFDWARLIKSDDNVLRSIVEGII